MLVYLSTIINTERLDSHEKKQTNITGGVFIMACRGIVRDAHRISGFTCSEFAVLKEELSLSRGFRYEGQSKENIIFKKIALDFSKKNVSHTFKL